MSRHYTKKLHRSSSKMKNRERKKVKKIRNTIKKLTKKIDRFRKSLKKSMKKIKTFNQRGGG